MKPISFRGAIFLATAVTCVLFFQNCSTGFDTAGNLSDGMKELATPSAGLSVISGGEASSLQVREVSSVATIPKENVLGAPSPHAILQRDSSGRVNLKLSIKDAPSKAAFFRTQIVSGAMTQTSNVFRFSGAPIELSVSTGMSSAALRIQLFDNAGVEVARWQNEPFMVGDVFLVAGQSNAATHGELPSKAQNPLNRTWSYESKVWEPLQDPMPLASHWKMQPFGGNPTSGGSVWPTFADMLSAQTGTPVGVISVAWGGSSVEHWLSGGSDTYKQQYQKDEPLVNRLIASAMGLSGCQFKAVLWHQGESDSVYGTSRTAYMDRLTRLRNLFVQKTGCNQPWVIARASFIPMSFNVPESRMMEIRTAQADISKAPGFAAGPDTDLLASPTHRYDRLHFSGEGLNKHARMWVEKVLALSNVSSSYNEEMSISEVRTVMGFYRDILKRKQEEILADYNGLFYHVRLLQEGQLTIPQVRASFENSDEAFIKQKFFSYHGRYPSSQEVQGLISKVQSGAARTREAIEIYIKHFFNSSIPASILGQTFDCGSFGDPDKNTMASWYKADLGRCPEPPGLNFWHAEWKRQSLSLSQWKVAVWDSNPLIQSFKRCLGSNPSDEVVTSCYRSHQLEGRSLELCGTGAPWVYKKGTERCYLK